jgi:hypothetical protein
LKKNIQLLIAEPTAVMRQVKDAPSFFSVVVYTTINLFEMPYLNAIS